MADAPPSPGWRAPAPAADAWVTWPAEFGTRFTVMVDTEEDFDWSAPLSRTGHGTASTAAIPEAARRFADRGVFLAWLVDQPILDDPSAVDGLRGAIADGRSSIGAQLHPWVSPPFDEVVGPLTSYAGNLPPALEAAKLGGLTAGIGAAFGTAPVVYRAGRYGIGPNTVPILESLGYAIDTSMRAYYDYSGQGGPDFSAIDNRAFRIGRAGTMIELPLTTVWTGRLRRQGAGLYGSAGRLRHGRGMLSRTGLLARIALSPEDMALSDALEAIAVAVGEGERLLNFAFHSPSLAIGHTPYVRDAAGLAAFWHWWDVVLADLARRGVGYATIADIRAAAALAR